VDDFGEDWIEVEFMSTVMQLPMCGHGTICLLTRLTEPGFIPRKDNQNRKVELRLPSGTADVELSRTKDGRVNVMLDINPPEIQLQDLNLERLLELLHITGDDLASNLPVEVAHGDFVHLMVPMKNLQSIKRIQPDFDGIVDYCHGYNLETIAPFSMEVEDPVSTLHVRDFCPAVGVPESAAAGTTNAALTSYLFRHGLVDGVMDGIEKNAAGVQITEITAEQGHEVGRPSRIYSKVHSRAGDISRLQVGGIATKIFEGDFYL